MTKTNLISKLLFPLIILGGSIFVGNESAFAININVGNQPGSSQTRPASNQEATIEETTYTNVPVPNFPGETMTCVITFDPTQPNEDLMYTGECFSNSLNEVASQYNPVDGFSVSGTIYDPEQPIPGAPAPDPVPITYDFTVTITDDFTGAFDPGPLVGKNFSGFFTFNSLGFTGVGEESFSVSDLSFRFQGTNYTEQDDFSGILDPFSSGPEVLFSSGEIEGLEFFADFLTLSKDDFKFQDGQITGNIAYTLRQDSSPSPEPGENSVSVPEPSAIFGLLMFSAMGYSSKLKKLKVKSQK
ncbi:MAG: hypothetical protein F6K23_35020 [Okeania sp. SIO2C9]|uniref:hypothetical protein n=1 Tax=Okeania sp. SIO2C9 TaxID=2607791 RepID=UPI0013C2670E|nr:hypothetical protein [Okeania sp. SIO2C9]NEQ77771.1 hypothetical protein [Okeania sp. SIO2C9]